MAPHVLQATPPPPAKTLLSALAAPACLIAFAAAGSFLACTVGFMLMEKPGGIALFWPSAGLITGARLALGRWSERDLAVGTLVGVLLANLYADRNPPLALSFAAANVLEFVLVARIAESFGRPWRFDTLGRVFGFFLAVALGTAVTATSAMLAIVVFVNPHEPLIQSWGVWLRSDFTGIIGLAPLIMTMPSLTPVPLARHAEGLGALGLLVVVLWILFTASPASHDLWAHIPALAALFPLLLFIAVRLPIFYSALAIAAVTVLVVVCTANGAWHTSQLELPLAVQAFSAQAVIVSAAVFSLTLAAFGAERHAADAKHRQLIAQLDHRVKNSLALTQAMADRSQENASSVNEFVATLCGRIASLARTHSKLSRDRWQGMWLAELLESELSPYRTASSEEPVGPPVKLTPAAAQALSTVVHELATNAVKHGALSTPHGGVRVAWRLDTRDGETQGLALEWREVGGPPIAPPQREGYGLSTIRELLPYEQGGSSVVMDFDGKGLVCTIGLPRTAIVPDPPADRTEDR